MRTCNKLFARITGQQLFKIAIGLSAVLAVNTSYADFMDRVLVIVNEDVITQSEFSYRVKTVQADMRRNNQNLEITPELRSQVLESMVADRLQIQEADRRGIEIPDDALKLALERFAVGQQLTPIQLRQRIEEQGQSFNRFSESVRETLVISRLTDYYASVIVKVPDYEIDGMIARNPSVDQYLVAQILISNTEKNQELADNLVSDLRSGKSFQQAVLMYSEATNAQDGGVLPWRTLEQLPDVWAQALKSIKVGDVTQVIRGENGLHILKLLELKGDREEILQSKVRHILISSNTQVAQAQAAKKLFNIRKRIIDGEDFSQLARIYSDDSASAALGGGLGWVSPGSMVPPFEQAYQKLALGEVSNPIATQYGMHIIEVLDRREKNITDQIIRSRADQVLRRQRAEREFEQWVRELKEQAYVEYVSEPV